ncbi:MAG TPA: NHL repeat-containing protein [Candidatus Limnocylindria bacterium]|nr:NHL repeat-containing protein [Candidatus Limnocylindria bacterium]
MQALIYALAIVLAAETRAVAPPDTSASPPADSVAAGAPFTLRDRGVVVPGGDGRGQVLDPSGLVVDAFGRIYVADATLNRVLRLEPDGRTLWEAGTLGSDPGQLRRPGSVALLGTLSLAVLDVENRRIVAYDLFGRLLGVTLDLGDPQLIDSQGRVDALALAADRGGALFVVDGDRDRLLAFDFSGRFRRAIGGFGARPGSFRGLRAVALAPRGELVTTERLSARVQRLDADGRSIASWPLPVLRGRGALPVAVDDSGRVAVAEESSGLLWVFDRTGTLLARLGGLGHPRALAFAPDGALLVAETQPGRVRRFTLEPAARE